MSISALTGAGAEGLEFMGGTMYIAHPVSIALIQVHFPLAGQFSGPACINCRALPKAVLQPQCICTLQTEYEIFRRHTAPGDGLLGKAENLVRSHANPILLNCRRVTTKDPTNHNSLGQQHFVAAPVAQATTLVNVCDLVTKPGGYRALLSNVK